MNILNYLALQVVVKYTELQSKFVLGKQDSMTNNQKKNNVLIIQGETQDGRKFRPSDWAERMSGMLSTFGDDHRIHYSPKLRPISLDGTKCIVLHKSLEESHSAIFAQIMDFASRNNLTILESEE